MSVSWFHIQDSQTVHSSVTWVFLLSLWFTSSRHSPCHACSYQSCNVNNNNNDDCQDSTISILCHVMLRRLLFPSEESILIRPSSLLYSYLPRGLIHGYDPHLAWALSVMVTLAPFDVLASFHCCLPPRLEQPASFLQKLTVRSIALSVHSPTQEPFSIFTLNKRFKFNSFYRLRLIELH